MFCPTTLKAYTRLLIYVDTIVSIIFLNNCCLMSNKSPAPFILNLNIASRWVVNITSRLCQCTFDKESGVLHIGIYVGRNSTLDNLEKINFSISGFEPRIIQPVTQSLHWILVSTSNHAERIIIPWCTYPLHGHFFMVTEDFETMYSNSFSE